MIDLDYDAALSDRTIDHLEEAARAVGLPLRELELIGQDATVAEGFIQSVREGRHAAFLEGVDWEALEATLYGAREVRDRVGAGTGVAPA